MTNTSLQGAADASDLLLTEARELRNKQDARLATIQRQSQLVVAGFLAIAAIVVAAASAIQPACSAPCQTDQPPYIIPLIAIVLGFAAVIGVAWFRVHRIPRHWREGPNSLTLWVPIIRSWALTRGFALHPGTRNRYEIRYTRTQHRSASRQVNDHGRVSGIHVCPEGK